MSNIKERLLGAITVMNDADAQKLWNIVQRLYGNDWDAVETVEPDDIDLQLIHAVQNDPECKIFASDDEIQAILG